MRVKSKRQAINGIVDRHNQNVIDYLRSLVKDFPVILDHQGRPVNHFQEVKKAFRKGGKDAVIEYIRGVNDKYIEQNYKSPYKRIYHKLKLKCQKIIYLLKQHRKQ